MTLEEAFAAALDHHRNGRLADAERLYRQILAADSRHADSLHLLGLIFLESGRPADAAALIGKAIEIEPRQAPYHSNLGIALHDLGRTGEAEAAYRAALDLIPGFADARYNLANLLQETGRPDQAVDAYCRVIALQPDYARAYTNLGNALQRLGRPDKAFAACHAALRLAPDLAENWTGLGGALRGLGRREEAAAAFETAARLAPGSAEIQTNLGNALKELGRFQAACDAFDAALRLDPDFAEAFAQRYHVRQHLCDWRTFAEDTSRLLNLIPTAEPPIPPLVLLTVPAGVPEQRAAGDRWLGRRCQGIVPLPSRPRLPGKKIRLGYMSAEFRAHAVPMLMVEVLEHHDRDRFEVIGYSLGPDDGSEMRQRLITAVDRFTDLRGLTHRAAAEIIAADGIDILIDLSGSTRDARPEILAHRPAPATISYIGFPGCMGGSVTDYIIGDSILIPPDQDGVYSETVLRLPNSYVIMDTKRVIAERSPTRAQAGLPQQGFVFCCFNNTHKLSPALFDIWMRLLSRIPGSVLWLLEANADVKSNLRREAEARGVSADRVVFAPRCPPADHMARQVLADLFLDTLPYNAHTTAAEALWMGLPVLTCMGNTFAARVAGSMLHALDLPELVTETLEDYEALALKLAEDPAALAAIRAKVWANRDTAPFFDVARYVRDLERAYEGVLQGRGGKHEG